MRPLAFAALALLIPAAAAQSGYGGLRGIVLPENPTYADGAGNWASEGLGGADGVFEGSPTLELTPLRAHRDPAPVVLRAGGLYGRYDFGRLPMGLYRLRVEAPGFEPWEAEVYVASDSQSTLHVLLHRED